MKRMWVVFSIIVVLGFLGCSKDSSVTAPDDPPVTIMKLVFESYRDGNAEIYSMNADGTGQTNLTNNSARDRDASVSPDGTKIVFSSERDGNGEIYVMNIDGTSPVRLTTNTSADRYPTWSPDGLKISFGSNRDGQYEIYTMNADGSSQTRLTTTGSNWASSWRGGYIYYEHDETIRRMTDTGTSDTEIISDGRNPSLSSDGTKMVFERLTAGATEVYVADANGSNVVRLTDSAGEDGEATWSPNGTTIVFMTCRPQSTPSTYNIATMTSTGAQQTVITVTNQEYKPCFVGLPR